MKGVRCSWVDMAKIRQALDANERGDGTRLAAMRCVGKSTVSQWQATRQVMDATEGKVHLSELRHFQPTHAREIATSFRRKEKDWSDATKAEIVEWVERCEAEELTVEQLREELRAVSPPKEQSFDLVYEAEGIYTWLVQRREKWPEELRHGFSEFVRRQLHRIEVQDDDRGSGLEGPQSGPGDAGDGAPDVAYRDSA